MSDPILHTSLISKSFGGLVAVNGVSLDFRIGSVHAIIGPNGAGKTTLINLLSGELLPSNGHIFFDRSDITNLKAHEVSQLGIGRSYQRTNIFPDFSCWQNVWLAAQSRQKTPVSMFKPAYKYKDIAENTAWALDISGLKAIEGKLASKISYGEQRQLEIAMLLAMKPRVLLLDEPLAGMSAIEAAVVIRLIKAIAKKYCIILIEHDMDAVFELANSLTVMHNGKVLVSGAPLKVRNDPKVIEAYLGKGETG